MKNNSYQDYLDSTNLDFSEYIEVLNNLSELKLKKVIKLIWSTYLKDNTIFFAGNGGSASLSSHFAADLTKNTINRNLDTKRIKTQSLTDNLAWITAIANDYGYEYIFLDQLKTLGEKGDLLIVISASGNSENIYQVVKWAKMKSIKCIGFTAFGGGKIAKILDMNICVNTSKYSVAESVHSVLQHVIIDQIKLLFEQYE